MRALLLVAMAAVVSYAEAGAAPEGSTVVMARDRYTCSIHPRMVGTIVVQ